VDVDLNPRVTASRKKNLSGRVRFVVEGGESEDKRNNFERSAYFEAYLD
jgi:hypothetical protein